MPNAFVDDYAQFPNDLTEKLPDLNKAASYKLLLVILRRVQQYGSMRVKISSKEAKLVTGLSDNGMTEARKELKAQRLVSSAEVNSQGLWLYEVTDPVTGELRRSRKERIDFNKLPSDDVIGYFMNRLRDYDPAQREDGAFRSRCPFHRTVKDRGRPFDFGVGDGGGVWNCFTCNKAGTMIDLEYDLAIEKGRVISRSTAHSNVKAIVQKLSIRLPEHDGPEVTI
jgi:hypothetical protein